MNPFVSVIVPCYNVETYVGECLESLRTQSFTDFEAICVNDGSTDGTRTVLEEFAQADSRILIVDRENGGLSAARNSGLDVARGEYVCFLDSDDKYAPYALEHLAEMAKSRNLDLLDFDSDTFYESDQVKKVHREGERKRDSIPGVMPGYRLLTEYEERGQYFPSACYHLIRRELLASTGLRFEEGLLHEDELFTPMLHVFAGPSAYLNEKLYLRRLRAESIMTSKRGIRNVAAEFHILGELYRWLREHAAAYDERFLHAFAQHIYLLADFTARDAMNCSEEELRRFEETLDDGSRVAFELFIVQHRNGTERFRQSYEDSRSYKAGRALTSLPRALRSLARP